MQNIRPQKSFLLLQQFLTQALIHPSGTLFTTIYSAVLFTIRRTIIPYQGTMIFLNINLPVNLMQMKYTRRDYSLRPVPATSRRDKSHRLNWPFASKSSCRDQLVPTFVSTNCKSFSAAVNGNQMFVRILD